MGTKILIIDDEKHIVELVTVLLEDNEEYQILKAYDGEEGLMLVERERPDLVLLDYMMPRMNGLEVLKEIKKHWPVTYVIIMTGKGSEKVAVTLMKAGASDYISKPFRADELEEIVETGVNMRRIEMQRKYTTETKDSAGLALQMKGKAMAAGQRDELTDTVNVDGQQHTITTRDLGPRDPLVSTSVSVNKAIKAQKSVDYGRYANRPNVKEIVNALVRRVHYEMMEGVLTGRLHTETL
jgi:DNA-binding response OmpR family regulator